MVRKISVLFTLFFLYAIPAFAQPTTVLVPFATAKLSWAWAQGTGGAVTEFRVKCGPSTGNYTATKVIVDPAARSVLVSAVVTQVGTYFCAVSAANQFGESPLSNEVSFQAGTVPTAPTGLSVSSN